MLHPERRSSERFAYRSDARPLLLVGEQAYEIVDLAERGIRVRCGNAERWLLGSVMEATVWFQRDSRLPVSGIVVRANAGELALKLDSGGIPPRALLDELQIGRAHV